MIAATLASTAPMPHPVAALALLDDPQEWSSFSHADRHDPAQWESSVVIEGMHCAACKSLITMELEESLLAEHVRNIELTGDNVGVLNLDSPDEKLLQKIKSVINNMADYRILPD